MTTSTLQLVEYCIRSSATPIDGLNPSIPIGQLGGGLLNAFEALQCSPPIENECLPANCNLVPNSGFEVPTQSYLIAFNDPPGPPSAGDPNPFFLNEICGWNQIRSSPHIVHKAVNEENYAVLFAGQNGGKSAIEIIATDELDINQGEQYTLEYDFYITHSGFDEFDKLVVGLIESIEYSELDNTYFADPGPAPSFPFIIDTQTGLTMDDPINLWEWEDEDFVIDLSDAVFHHRTVTCFTIPEDGEVLKYLAFYAQRFSNPYSGVLIDNIVLKPCIELSPSVDEISNCINCTQLHVNEVIGEEDEIHWDAEIGGEIDPDFQFSPTRFDPNPFVCINETTTFIVTVTKGDTGCPYTEEITVEYEDDCEIDCEEVDIKVKEECDGYETITKVYINDIALDPSELDWVDINWVVYELGGIDEVILDKNCMNFPIGTIYSVSIHLGEDCSPITIHSIDVEHPNCINCEFTVEQINCKGNTAQLIMVDAEGNPIEEGPNGNYIVNVIWALGTNFYYTNPLNSSIPIGTSYQATLEITHEDGEVICSESIDGIVTGACPCSEEFTEENVTLTHSPGSDLHISWESNGALSYEVEVSHNYIGCETTTTCQFELDQTSNSISLALEGCFYTCQEYNITITAICGDGTTYQVILGEIDTTPIPGVCGLCDDGSGGGGSGDGSDDGGDDTGGKKGKRMLATPIATNLNIYPNPAQNHFSLQFDSPVDQAQIQLFDLSGKQVGSQEVRNTSTTLVDVSQLEASVYLVKISIEAQEPIFRKIAIVK